MTDKWNNFIEKLDFAFQPIVHSHTGKIFAVEALIRNVVDNINFTSIHDFFDKAYEDDLIYELDLHLREIAIKKFSQIDIENIKLFYNLDNRIIYNKKYSSGNTLKILSKYNLKKNDICFELSERGTAIEQIALSSAIDKYKNSGFCIAIDDFGIGVSGLKLLYFSEANIIKIDRFFISNIDQDKKKKLFCSSIIEMAHIMGIKVVAEGVETAKEFYTCKDIGADFIQGFLIQRPTLNINELKKVYMDVIELIKNDSRQYNLISTNSEYIKRIKPLSINTSLYNLFLHFKNDLKNNFVPIVDENSDFLGVIYESDIKKISYSQYGLALAQNKTFSSRLERFIQPALSVEISWGIDKILEIYNMNAKSQLGIFITQSNQYIGFIDLNSLLTLSYKRNIEIATNQNPLTKLPGNKQIEKFISLNLNNSAITHIIYFDFNNFKPFNDLYGFRQGDRAILIFAELLQKRFSNEAFIAHIGGDDFFVGLNNFEFTSVHALAQEIQMEFENSVKNLYSQDDKNNNFVIAKDRYNVQRKFDLLSVSTAILEINPKSKLENFDYCISMLKKESKYYKHPLFASI